jgi:alginate O-acetyltransferase complex protein AlgI
MSLGSWFRDYLYFPMGGNRVSKPRFFFNLFVVWMATGFWHGAAWTFIFWGLYFAVLLIIEKSFLLKYLNKTRVIKHIYVLFFVIVSFVIFDSVSLGEAFNTVGAMLGAGDIPAISQEALFYLKSFGVILVIAAVGSTPLPKKIVTAIGNSSVGEKVVAVGETVVLMGLLALCTAFLIDGSFNPFLYFRF